MCETCHCGDVGIGFLRSLRPVPKLLVTAMQPIADWLKKLGMSECAQRFADNDIDASVLRDLTDQDLKDIGVALGHRRKLLRAIAETVASTTTTPQATAAFEPKPRDDAERRQLTVMFCDLAVPHGRTGDPRCMNAAWARDRH